jgi:hypothetical protein
VCNAQQIPKLLATPDHSDPMMHVNDNGGPERLTRRTRTLRQ